MLRNWGQVFIRIALHKSALKQYFHFIRSRRTPPSLTDFPSGASAAVHLDEVFGEIALTLTVKCSSPKVQAHVDRLGGYQRPQLIISATCRPEYQLKSTLNFSGSWKNWKKDSWRSHWPKNCANQQTQPHSRQQIKVAGVGEKETCAIDPKTVEKMFPMRAVFAVALIGIFCLRFRPRSEKLNYDFIGSQSFRIA